MRQSGRSTRIVDQAVQDLFENGFCVIIDHHHGESPKEHKKANEHTLNILLKRVDREHGGISNFVIDYKRNRVSLKDYLIK